MLTFSKIRTPPLAGMRRFFLALALVALPGGCAQGGTEREDGSGAGTPSLEALPADVPVPDGVTADAVAHGSELFHGQAVCYACHGQNGKGGPLAPDLTDGEWLNAEGSYLSIVEVIESGVPEPSRFPGIMLPRGGMPLTDEETRAIAAYVWSAAAR